MIHLLAHLLGLDNANSSWYLFFSGVGSDIGEFALIGAILRAAFNLRKQHERHHQALMTKLTEKNDN
jgi:hypothetical protein